MEKGQTLRDLYERRQPAYLKWADAVVDAEGLGVEETVARVVAAVRETRRKRKRQKRIK